MFGANSSAMVRPPMSAILDANKRTTDMQKIWQIVESDPERSFSAAFCCGALFVRRSYLGISRIGSAYRDRSKV
jgi:hypothetical protein